MIPIHPGHGVFVLYMLVATTPCLLSTELVRSQSVDDSAVVGNYDGWSPHSVFSECCQRPDRGSSPGMTGPVQWVHPILG